MARCTCEHARLAGFHQLELAQFEGVLVDHALGDAVAVVARLDAIDLVAQLVGELRDIGEAAQAAVVDVLGNRQGVLGALQVGAQRLDRAFLGVLLDVVGHGGHPVAQEYVEVVVGQGAVGHRHREQIDLGLVAEDSRTWRVTAVVTVMSVQPTSAKRTDAQDSGSAAWAASGAHRDTASSQDLQPFIANSSAG